MSISDRKLFICRIPRHITSYDLEDEFEKFGEIRNIILKENFGFIEFKYRYDAEDAQNKMNGKKIWGSRIVVEFAINKTRNNDCFRCGKAGHWAKQCSDRSNLANKHDNSKPKDSWNFSKNCSQPEGTLIKKFY